MTSDVGAAELWTRTCMRCHNLRSPDGMSDHDWKITVRHMRTHAYLTGEEERRILQFLQSSN